MAKNEAWGIDVGSNAVKAVKLVRSGSGLRVADFAILPFKQILTMPDLNVDEMIQVQLDTLIQKHEIEKSTVVAAVPGNMAFARFAKLPPVEPKKIPDIVKFEAQQQIPFPIDQVEWDYQVFQQQDSPDVEVGIFAITKERVMNYLSNFRAVNLDVDSLTLSPLAVYNAFRYDQPEQGVGESGVVYMDIGTVSTDVIIVENGGIWLRTLPIGGNNFTEALVKQFKISFNKAEKLKREAATSKYAKQIFQAMRAVFADLVQEVQRSLGFYQSLNRDSNLTKLVGVGSTFRLPGLQKFIKQQLQIEVVRPDKFEKIAVDGKREAEFASHAINLATAYGLALQGLGEEKVSANVLPGHILASRMWRAKQPWIAAAAACFLVAAGLVGVKYYTDRAAYETNLAAGEADVRNVIRVANEQAAEWEKIQTNNDPRQFIENLRRVLDHRNVMSRLLEDITLATMALNPQEGLMSTDYEKIAQYPRNQRNRIYIDEITFAYQPLPAEAAAGTTTTSGDAAASGLDTLVDGTYNLPRFFPEDQSTGPRFLVTISGTTPVEQPDTFLNSYFIKWLKDNADRPDRPYVYKLEEQTIIRKLTEVTDTSTAGAVAEPATTGGNFQGGFGGQAPTRTFNPPPRQNNAASGQAGEFADIDALLPDRPNADESRGDDWQFELQWIVQLRPPQDARPKVNTPTAEDTPSAEEAPTAEDTPAEQPAPADAAAGQPPADEPEPTPPGPSAGAPDPSTTDPSTTDPADAARPLADARPAADEVTP